MPKPLSELRKSDHIRRPETTVSVTLASDLTAQWEQLNQQFLEATADAQVEARQREAGKPVRLADRSALTRADELGEQLDDLAAQMGDQVVVVRLRAASAGDWNLWKAEHPARDDNPRDQRNSGGLCDFDALIEALEGYVVAINDEPPAEGDWAWLLDSCNPRAIDDIATAVLNLHEGSFTIPKSRRALLTVLMNDTASK